MKGAEEQDGAAPLDLEAIRARLGDEYPSDAWRWVPRAACSDVEALVEEVERLRAHSWYECPTCFSPLPNTNLR